MASDANCRHGAALVIGVGQYPHRDIAPLRFATRDAHAMAAAFADPQVCAFPDDQVALLTDEAAHRDAIIHHLSNWLPQRGQGADIVVIYFAGHGMVQKVGKKEEGFLFPHDADPANPASRGVPMTDVARWVEGIEAQAVVLCLDCCHAGKVLPRGGSGETVHRALAIRPALLENLAGKGRFLLASCDEGQYSMELADLGHGLFTYHLLQGMGGAGDRDGDGKVGVAELFEYVSEAVARDARKHGFDQKPWNASVGAGGVYLAAPKRRAQATVLFPAPGHTLRPDTPTATMGQVERLLQEGNDEQLTRQLRPLTTMANPAAVAVFFRCLQHGSEAVRELAQRGLQVLGRERTLAAVKDLAGGADERALQILLDGLALLEVRNDLVELLDHLVDRLEGEPLVRAHQLLEKKRLGLGLEQTRELFLQNHSPYELEKVLGQGLLTASYLARHAETNLQVVVRVLRPEFVSQPDIRKRFWDLSRRSMQFVHQNLVLTREVGSFPGKGVYFTVRDYVPGVTLQEVLHGGKRFEPAQIEMILRQVVQALTPVHREKVVHGAVKPSNIFLGGEDVVMLGEPSPPIQGMGEMLQKRLAYDYRYAAPEVFLGDPPPSAATDFYAVGCVAYELFCGRPPFVADHYNQLGMQHAQATMPAPRMHNPTVSAAVDKLLLRFLDKDPSRRIGNVKEAMEICFRLTEPPEPTVKPPEKKPPPVLREESVVQYRPPVSMLSLNPMGTIAPEWEARQSAHSPASASLPIIPGYEILAELGRGGMSVVYKALHVALKRLVALKVVRSGVHASDMELARFRTEAEAVARLRHPNIVQIFEVGEYQGLAFCALEFCEGGSLHAKLAGNPLPALEAARLTETLARAVHAAHLQAIVHRDLKPQNVLLTLEGVPKVTDFGLAKILDADIGQTAVGMVMGTPSYMPPEQARGEPVGPLTDVYALGAILYECLTGRPPFKGPTTMDSLRQTLEAEPVPPRLLNPRVPRDLEIVSLKCLQKNPDRRYASAAALAEDLRRCHTGEPIMARPVGTVERTLKWVRRRPAAAALVVALGRIVGLILALLILWWER
jgi:serine/threonine protein kinase